MGRMKDLHITIHNGGDEAVAAVERMGKDWREQLEQAASEIERLRLTDEERGAIAAGLGALETLYEDAPAISRPIYDAYAPTLRRLLKRTGAT
jgi:hypothetical protein